jgi:hypothetical protein
VSPHAAREIGSGANVGSSFSKRDNFYSMTPTQFEKAQSFRALHQSSGAFVMPNPWDAGSARILASHQFQGAGEFQFRLGGGARAP